MKNIIIKDGRNYKVISGNAISILEQLPAAIYELSFTQEKGFSLNEANSRFNISGKLYGGVETIANRVLQTFEAVEGNLGVLFSGPKGLGKSLTTRYICEEALKKGFPVILVTEHFDNISSFIETINQTSVIVFDEFEKNYPNQKKKNHDEWEGQDSLLGLFDSTLSSKKLFLLTCNDTGKVSEYLLNRPGRLHYHFRSLRLSIEDITQYCHDNLPVEMENIIPDICSLGARIPNFSYDMLKAVVFELATYQCDLSEVIRVLNIDERSNTGFSFTVYFKSGRIENGAHALDIGDDRDSIMWYGKSDSKRDSADVNMTKATWTGKQDGSLFLDGSNVYWSSEDEKTNDRIEKVIFIPVKTGNFCGDSYD